MTGRWTVALAGATRNPSDGAPDEVVPGAATGVVVGGSNLLVAW
jgi:hypothetical protein